MPHDQTGRPINPGDHVTMKFRVESVAPESADPAEAEKTANECNVQLVAVGAEGLGHYPAVTCNSKLVTRALALLVCVCSSLFAAAAFADEPARLIELQSRIEALEAKLGAEAAPKPASFLASGWNKGSPPDGTWHYGGVVLKEASPKAGFYFADFQGNKVRLHDSRNRVVDNSAIAYWNNSLRVPILDERKQATAEPPPVGDPTEPQPVALKLAEGKSRFCDCAKCDCSNCNCCCAKPTASKEAAKPKRSYDYAKLARDSRPGDLSEEEYAFIRENIPTGDPFRNLTSRELEATDPWYRESTRQEAYSAYREKEAAQSARELEVLQLDAALGGFLD